MYQILHTPTEELIRTPGLPPLYKYENFPQEVSCAAWVTTYSHNNNGMMIRLL